MALPSDWKSLKIPLGLTVSAIGAILALWSLLQTEFVQAQEFRTFKQTIETRSLTRDKIQVENEILKIEVKCTTYPEKCDAIDKALLAKYKADLSEVKAELKSVMQQQVQK